MDNRNEDKQEKHILFVAKHYKEGSMDTEKAWKKFASNHSIIRKTPVMHYLLRVAAVLLLLVGFGTFYVWEHNRPDWIAISTVKGQIKNVYLPDSSLISLAGNSSIRYNANDYGKEGRVVEMKGKAFFQVKRDKTRLFSVETRLAEVRVLGTSFQVDAAGNTVGVNVETGKVSFAITQTNEEVILTAGMSAHYSDGEKAIDVHTEEEGNYLSWKTGLLRFTETPLDQVIRDVADYYQVEVKNNIPRPDAKLTASFNNRPLNEVLTVINQTLDVQLLSVKK